MSESKQWSEVFPGGVRRDIVIDTDTANETDDQYAVCWALFFPEAFRVRGIYAAPFRHNLVVHPGEGMMNCYWEIQRVLACFPDHDVPSFVGAPGFYEDIGWRPNPAVLHLITISKGYTRENPLLIVAIGALTNIATALMLDPTLTERCELLWLGGQDYSRSPAEFNLSGDLAATKVVMESGIKVHLFPCAGIAETLLLKIKTAKSEVQPQGALGRLLYGRLVRMIGGEDPERATPIWDIAPFVALTDPNLVDMEWADRREIEFEPLAWGKSTGQGWWMNRALRVDEIFAKFFARLRAHHEKYPWLKNAGF